MNEDVSHFVAEAKCSVLWERGRKAHNNSQRMFRTGRLSANAQLIETLSEARDITLDEEIGQFRNRIWDPTKNFIPTNSDNTTRFPLTFDMPRISAEYCPIAVHKESLRNDSRGPG